jgi:hypothetical protein
LKGKGNYIPRFINTAYLDIYQDVISHERLYAKPADQEKLFADIIKKIKNNPVKKVHVKYPEVFECFGENYLGKEAQNHLTHVLVAIDENSWTLESFNTLRKIIEAIYLFLHDMDDNLIPHACVQYEKREVNFEYCARRLFSGKDIRDRQGNIISQAIPRVVPEHLGWMIQPLDKICSICSHSYQDQEYVNQYTIQTVTFGVMEFILWMKKYVDKHYHH